MNADNKHKRTQKKLHGRHHDPKTSMCSHHLQHYSSVNCNQEVSRLYIIDTDTHSTAQVPKPVCYDQFERWGLDGGVLGRRLNWEVGGGGGGNCVDCITLGVGRLRSSLCSGDVLHLSFTSWLCSLCVVCDRAPWLWPCKLFSQASRANRDQISSSSTAFCFKLPLNVPFLFSFNYFKKTTTSFQWSVSFF